MCIFYYIWQTWLSLLFANGTNQKYAKFYKYISLMLIHPVINSSIMLLPVQFIQ